MDEAIISTLKQRVLCKSPRVVLTPNIVSHDLTKSVIAIARPKLQRALVSGSDSGVISEARSADVVWLGHDYDPVIRSVVDTIAIVAGLDSHRAEQFHIIRYPVGGEYRSHFDSYDLQTERGRRCTAIRGQRILTALLYLNDDFTGGQTRFPLLDLGVRASEGTVLTFENCETGNLLPHPNSLHAGAPVIQGEKWVGTLWFRER